MKRRTVLRGIAMVWGYLCVALILSELTHRPHIRDVSIIAMIALCFVFGVVVWPMVRQRERERLAKAGRCARCGYDLTGNTSGICPECGTTVSQKSDSTP